MRGELLPKLSTFSRNGVRPHGEPFVERLKVKYAFQVVADTAPSSVNPFDYEGQPVNIAFVDFVKVLI